MATHPLTTLVARLGALLCLTAGIPGCAEEDAALYDSGIADGDLIEDTGLDPTVATLTDDDGAALEGSIEAERIEVATGVDVLLDWSGLTQDLWSRPLAPLTEAQYASLYHFTTDDLDAVLDGLLHGTLYQNVIDLQVSCESETASCRMSELSFMLGHAVDVVEMFREPDGLWLLTVQSNGGREDLAYLVLVPVEGSDTEVAEVHDDSSIGHLDADMHSLPAVDVERDSAMRIDWSGLTRDCLGDDMDPRLLDTLKLARVPEDLLDDPQQVVIHLGDVADEMWEAHVPGSESSFPLAEVRNAETGDLDFQGPDGPGAWLLTLGCSTCDDSMPRFLTRVDAQ